MEYSSDPSIQSEKREGIAQLIDNIQTDVSIDLLQIGVNVLTYYREMQGIR